MLVASSFFLRRPFTPPTSPSPEVCSGPFIAFLNLAHSLARPVFAFSCTQNREQTCVRVGGSVQSLLPSLSSQCYKLLEFQIQEPSAW